MKKTNMDEFLDNCSDEQIMTLLLFTKAQLQDRLNEVTSRCDNERMVQ